MNKKIIWTTFILLALTLTACTSTTATTDSASNGSSLTVELPMQTKLILGTINLNETDYAVTAEQATELLPMFYVLKDLNESTAAAPEEIDGLIDQIQETLTTEQTRAIEDMNLGREDMMTLMQQTGTSGRSGSSQTGTGSNAGGSGFAGGPPDMPAVGSSAGGPDMGDPSPSTTSTASDSNPVSQTMSGTPSTLFNAAIELLQKKIDEQ